MTAQEYDGELKPIPDFPDYLISKNGRVFRIQSGGDLRELKHYFSKGYRKVWLNEHCKGSQHRVHRLVLGAFVGPCPPGYEGAHLNGDRADCRLENLRWVTPRENHSHKWLHGTQRAGENHPFAKLSESDVLTMRRLSKDGITNRQLAKQFNVSIATVSYVKNRVWWKHI